MILMHIDVPTSYWLLLAFKPPVCKVSLTKQVLVLMTWQRPIIVAKQTKKVSECIKLGETHQLYIVSQITLSLLISLQNGLRSCSLTIM